jgi:hypothetical protein
LHELALDIGKEEHLLTFLEKIEMHVRKNQFSNEPEIMKILSNQQNKDGKSPLHQAIMTGRKVKKN